MDQDRDRLPESTDDEESAASPRRKSTISIRAAMTAALLLLGLVAGMLVVALATLTTQLNLSATTLESAVEGLRFAETVAARLLQHNRATGSGTGSPAAIEAEVTALFDSAQRNSSTPSTEQAFQELDRAVDAYFAAHRAAEARGLGEEAVVRRVSEPLAEALEATRLYGDALAAKASRAKARASAWNSLANVIALAALALTVLVVAAAVIWIRRAAFRPVLRLGEAMERFRARDYSSRAPVEGPLELREIAQQFNEMASDLGHQRERQLTFMASAVHDLRNPISALQLSAMRLAPGRAPLSAEQARAMGELIGRQLGLLNRMTEDLLDASRIGAGRLELKPQRRDLRQLVRDAVGLFASADSEHSIETRLPPAPVPIHADPVRIEQVLNNLLSNALKYSPPGSRVVVRVELADQALVSVTDEGVGISAEDLPHIFEPFRRTRSARKSSVRGVGLGLFVTRRIVEAHRGSLEVQSTPGRGSTFSVRLPLSAQAGLEPSDARSEEPPSEPLRH